MCARFLFVHGNKLKTKKKCKMMGQIFMDLNYQNNLKTVILLHTRFYLKSNIAATILLQRDPFLDLVMVYSFLQINRQLKRTTFWLTRGRENYVFYQDEFYLRPLPILPRHMPETANQQQPGQLLLWKISTERLRGEQMWCAGGERSKKRTILAV